MKTKLLSALSLVLLLTVGAYAQDSTAIKKEMRKQERAERKARVKQDVKNTSRKVTDVVDKETKKIGTAVNTGLDKAESAVITEGRKLKNKRDSSQTEKAKRDTL